MSQQPLSLVAFNSTDLVGHVYREAIHPLIKDLAKDMEALIAAKKHFVVYLREVQDFALNAKSVQATLRYHYKRLENAEWVKWRKNPELYVEEPPRYSDPRDASAFINIDGLPGGNIAISVRFKLTTYQNKTGVELADVNYEWGNALGSRHLDTTEKFLISHNLSAAKAKAIKVMVE